MALCSWCGIWGRVVYVHFVHPKNKRETNKRKPVIIGKANFKGDLLQAWCCHAHTCGLRCAWLYSPCTRLRMCKAAVGVHVRCCTLPAQTHYSFLFVPQATQSTCCLDLVSPIFLVQK